MLCQFLLYREVNQLYVKYIPPLHKPPFPTPIPPLSVITEHRAEFPMLYSRLPLAGISHMVMYQCYSPN